ncbi:MAG: prepilin-type N-terminal cleavage/methylation domain-containing protein [Candidatus Omnitrophota bacterium]
MKRRCSKIKKFPSGLTLIEVLIALSIFSLLSVSLYLLLRGGIIARRRIEVDQTSIQGMHLVLERIAQEIRGCFAFKKEDSGFKGENKSLEFYSTIFDYSLSAPAVRRLIYRFHEGTLVKDIIAPFSETAEKTFTVLDGLDGLSFYYFNNQESVWQEVWEDSAVLPLAVKIEASYKDNREKVTVLDKHIFIYGERQ